MTRKLCTFSGCSAIVDHPDDNTSPRCPKHAPKQSRKRYDHHYSADGSNIYKSSKWKRTRALKLRADPLCQRHLEIGMPVPADMVDHIKEISDGGDLWDWDNLQSLCNACHNTKTGLVKRARNRKTNIKKLSDY